MNTTLTFRIVVTLLAIAFLAPVFFAIIRNGHSASDDLYHLFVYMTCTAFWWKWATQGGVKKEKQ